MRIVQEVEILAGAGQFRGGKPTKPSEATKAYLERVAKYVPGEIVAAYLTANGVAADSSQATWLLPTIFGICTVVTPFYITTFCRTRLERVVNSCMATIAFVVWAYATGGGMFKFLDLYSGPVASVGLIVFSLISGVIEPKATVHPRQPKLVHPEPRNPTGKMEM